MRRPGVRPSSAPPDKLLPFSKLHREIAEIVHDIDLKDDKFHRLEAAGLNAIIDGLSQVLRDDRKLLHQTSIVFDGPYELLNKEADRRSHRAKAIRYRYLPELRVISDRDHPC